VAIPKAPTITNIESSGGVHTVYITAQDVTYWTFVFYRKYDSGDWVLADDYIIGDGNVVISPGDGQYQFMAVSQLAGVMMEQGDAFSSPTSATTEQEAEKNIRDMIVENNDELSIEYFGMPVELLTPGGIWLKTHAKTGAPLKALMTQYGKIEISLTTGEPVVLEEPIVTMSLLSLVRVPKKGERWVIKMPIEPSPSAPLVTFGLNNVQAPDGGSSLGTIQLYPKELVTL